MGKFLCALPRHPDLDQAQYNLGHNCNLSPLGQCMIWTPLQSFWGLESFWAGLQCTVRSYWWDGTRDNTGALPCWGPDVPIIWGPAAACPPGPNIPFSLDRIPVSGTALGWQRASQTGFWEACRGRIVLARPRRIRFITQLFTLSTVPKIHETIFKGNYQKGTTNGRNERECNQYKINVTLSSNDQSNLRVM